MTVEVEVSSCEIPAKALLNCGIKEATAGGVMVMTVVWVIVTSGSSLGVGKTVTSTVWVRVSLKLPVGEAPLIQLVVPS